MDQPTHVYSFHLEIYSGPNYSFTIFIYKYTVHQPTHTQFTSRYIQWTNLLIYSLHLDICNGPNPLIYSLHLEIYSRPTYSYTVYI